MGKLALRILLGLFVAVFMFGVSGYAEEEAADPEGALPAGITDKSTDKDILSKMSDKDIKDLARTAFVVEKNGEKWLFFRLTVMQCHRLERKVDRPGKKIAPKVHGITRFLLHPRQRFAIRQALAMETPLKKVIVRVSDKRAHKSEGLKGRYLVRRAKNFTGILDGNYDEEKLFKDKESTDEPAESVVTEVLNKVAEETK
jgi:hypothetical protein